MKLKEDFIRAMKTYKSIKTILKSELNQVTISSGWSQIDLGSEDDHVQILIDNDIELDISANFNQDSLSKLINLKIKESVEVANDKVILDGKSIPYQSSKSSIDRISLAEYKSQFTCKAVEFKAALKSVIPAIGNDITRPILDNVLLDGNSLVAVDGYRIFTRSINIESDVYTLLAPVVVKILMKLLPNKSDDILTISKHDDMVSITWEDFTIIYKERKGEFLKWKQMFSDDYEYKVEVNRQNLIDEVEFIANTQEEPKKAIVKLTIESDGIKLGDKLLNADVDYHPTRHYEPLVILFRVKYLLDSLKSSKDEYVALRFISALTPVIIDNQDLILPIRLNS